MNSHRLRGLILGITVIALTAPSLMAQKYEINPYGGYIWPGSSSVGHLRNNSLYGVRAGFFLDPNFELELNAGWINHFNIKSIDPKSRGLLWEVAGDYNFSTSEFPFSRKFSPFLIGGVGGITTFLKDVDSFPFNQVVTGTATIGPNPITGGPVTVPVTATRPLTIDDGDTFFAVSYGGGIKSIRLWGPFGLRGEVRGRTLPNYYGGAPTWLELTGGFNLMWGER